MKTMQHPGGWGEGRPLGARNPARQEVVMALIKWEPLREMEDMFDRYTRAMGWPANRGQELVATGDWTPRVDISETDKEFVVKAEIPEVKKEEIKVNVDNGVVTIQGERKHEKEEKGKKFHRVECYYGKFARSFTLPDNIDETKIKASFKDGMLNLQIPKSAAAKPKAIEVKVE
jgi:HSP20 family protein